MYGIRAVQRGYCLLPYPNGYIWGAPKFGNVNWPSLVVPVKHSLIHFYTNRYLTVYKHYAISSFLSVPTIG